MMPHNQRITKGNALDLIKKFATKYRKKLGKIPGEMIFVGGGSVVLNYQFRDSTQDFDVILKTSAELKDIIIEFAEENDLPSDWLNSEFIKTPSYSEALAEVSTHLCTLNNGTLEIRTVSGVYLIAMKLKAHREYRNDISDVIGILMAEKEEGNTLDFSMIEAAYAKLYYERIPEKLSSKIQLYCGMDVKDLKDNYLKQNRAESEIGTKVVTYLNDGADINEDNVENVIAKIKEKMQK